MVGSPWWSKVAHLTEAGEERERSQGQNIPFKNLLLVTYFL
jgi:hypothetical protein